MKEHKCEATQHDKVHREVWTAQLGEHTAVVGIDMLLELLQGAQTNHRTTAEPERGHGSELLMQNDEELMETAPANDVLQVPIPERKEEHNTAWPITISTA